MNVSLLTRYYRDRSARPLGTKRPPGSQVCRWLTTSASSARATSGRCRVNSFARPRSRSIPKPTASITTSTRPVWCRSATSQGIYLIDPLALGGPAELAPLGSGVRVEEDPQDLPRRRVRPLRAQARLLVRVREPLRHDGLGAAARLPGRRARGARQASLRRVASEGRAALGLVGAAAARKPARVCRRRRHVSGAHGGDPRGASSGSWGASNGPSRSSRR